MRHSFLDKYSDGSSVIHRADARVKIAAAAVMLLALNVFRLPRWYILAGAVGVLLVAVIVARLPLGYVFRRAAVVLPFAGVVGVFLPVTTAGAPVFGWDAGGWAVVVTDAGLRLYVALLAKAYLSLAFVTLLVATTPFTRLLAALAWFRVPAFFLALLSFTYRYIFVLVGTAARVQRAWGCRYFGRRRAAQFLVLGPAVGVLFARAYERAARVWYAMLSRGYDPGLR